MDMTAELTKRTEQIENIIKISSGGRRLSEAGN